MPIELQVIITLNIVTIILIVGYGYRIIRFISRIEHEHELMWKDYEKRMNLYQHMGEKDGTS